MRTQNSLGKGSPASWVHAVCLGLAALGLSTGAAPAQVVTQFSTGITAGAASIEITTGPDGNLWFTESNGNRVGRITSQGVITQFSVGITTGAGPLGITGGPDGNVWFAENDGGIGRITPLGVITEFRTGISAGSFPRGITTGPDGNLWFTEQSDGIGRITPLGVVTEFTAGITSGARPVGITTGPDGNLWFTEFAGRRIGRITPQGVVTQFSAGITGMNLQSIAAGLDGNLWFTEVVSDRIGRITPLGVVTEFSAGITSGANPAYITSGPDGNLWFTEVSGSRIGRITPLGVVSEFGTGITSGSGPLGITAGPDGNVWFTEYNQDRIGRITTGAACNIDGTTLCLSGDRFKVQAHWATPDGRSGSGQAVQLTSDTGYFWFFGSSNVEMVIKVLNACGINQDFWVFAGGLTNVQVDLTVTDSLTSEVKTYRNPQNTAFLPIQDTSAFATCSAGTDSLSPRGNVDAERTAAPPAQEKSGPSAAVLPVPSGGFPVCTPNATTLCLSNGRFKVQTNWATSDGGNGSGQAVQLTSDTGYFWFFSSSNVEMIVKVLNACGFASRIWVFGGGLTNVQVDMTVTDTQTGTVRTYHNPQNTAFLPIQDTNAFSTCP